MIVAKARGSKAEWQGLTGGLGYMGVSLYSRNHQGPALASIVEWVNDTGKFASFRVGLSDTLNRFNTAHSRGIDLCTAYRIAAEAGDRWLRENAATLDQLRMPHDVVRWSYWLENYQEEIERYKKAFGTAFEEQPLFKQAVLQDIGAYAKRTHDKPVCELGAAEFQTSLNYLIEELAVYSVILREFPATTVYPGKQLNCFAFMRENKTEQLPDSISKTGFIRLGIHGIDVSNDPPKSQQNVKDVPSSKMGIPA